jgi:hypothetical protein
MLGAIRVYDQLMDEVLSRVRQSVERQLVVEVSALAGSAIPIING